MSHKRTKISTVQWWLPRLLVAASATCLLLFVASIPFARSTPQTLDQSSTRTEELPDTTEPHSDELSNHTAPADQPRLLSIRSINVRARVFSVGLDNQSRIDVPKNIHDVGWFDQSSKPGLPGATVLDGHVSSQSSHGVFHDLKKLVVGDTITVELGDHRIVNYTVVTTNVYDFDKVDMAAVLRPINTNKPGLNLITCGGKVIEGTHQFDKRVVVFASAQ